MALVHVAKGSMNGQRGNLPGHVATELGEERLTLGGVENADRFRDQIGVFDVVKRAKLLHKVLFALEQAMAMPVRCSMGARPASEASKARIPNGRCPANGMLCLRASSTSAK